MKGVTVDGDLALLRLHESGQHPEQGRLPGTGRAGDGDHLSWRDAQVNRAQDLVPGVGDMDVASRDLQAAPGLLLHVHIAHRASFEPGISSVVAVPPSVRCR